MRQNHSRQIDSVGRNMRNRRGAPHRKPEKSIQNQNSLNTNNSSDNIMKPNPQSSKKENSNNELRNHFGNLLNCLKSNKKKQYLLQLAGKPIKTPEIQDMPSKVDNIETSNSRNSFMSDFFFDIPTQKLCTSSLKSNNDFPRFSKSNEIRLDRKVGHSYFLIQRPPGYSCEKPHFADFICNSLYKVQALGEEGEKKKRGNSNDSSPQPVYDANANLSENIDMHSIETIEYNKLFNDFFDSEKRKKIAKAQNISTEEEYIDYIVSEKIDLDRRLHLMEDDVRYIYRAPVSLSLNNFNSRIPSFKLSSLRFLCYMIFYIDSKMFDKFYSQSSQTPHNRKLLITKCLRRFIPIILRLLVPVIIPWNHTDYYQSIKNKLAENNSNVSTSLTQLSELGILDKEIRKMISASPQYNYIVREWPIHLLLPPLHIRYLIILFDLFERLDEYFQELPFIPFRSTFGLDMIGQTDLTAVPNEIKRLYESIEKGGSLAQKFYDLRNISYQMRSVRGLQIFDRELQIIESCIQDSTSNKKHALTEEILLDKMRHDIIDQKPYSVKFLLNNNDGKISFSFNEANMNKLNISRRFDESYVFPNYSVNVLQPVKDETLVKYDGILKSNMTFSVSGSSEPSDDQFHVQFTEGSYGIICNYTDLL